MVVRISDKTQNYSKVTKLLVKPIDIAKKSQILVVVEGVESKQDDLFIKNLGADVGQGYFYGRPLSISAFNDLIETK